MDNLNPSTVVGEDDECNNVKGMKIIDFHRSNYQNTTLTENLIETV